MLNILLLAVFLASCCVACQYQYHMFQLNSYQAPTQLRWLRQHWKSAWLLRSILLLLPLPFLGVPSIATPLAAGVFALNGWLCRPRAAKKPLVYTPRVKRMLATNAILLVLVAGAAWRFAPGLRLLLLLAVYTLAPLWPMLANAINSPMEKAINRWYINDAKRMIDAMPDLLVIGVTGSYGKTSVKHYLGKLLSAKYNVLITPESYNTTLGVVKTIRTSLTPVHQIFVCEMGAKGLGEIKEICDIVHPDLGIITSIGPQHLESFGSIENIIKTKFELADALPSGGTVFLNYGNEYIRARACANPVVSYGVDNAALDYSAHITAVSAAGSEFTLRTPQESLQYTTRLIGAHNVENIAGAIAVARFLGVLPGDIAIGVRRLESVPHRLQLISRAGGDIIIDDAYNSNTSGVKAALDALALFDGVKILVTPGMIELGDAHEKYNRIFGTQAAAVCDYVVLVGKAQTVPIYNGLLDENFDSQRILVADSLQQGFAWIAQLPVQGRQKIILLENDLPDNY